MSALHLGILTKKTCVVTLRTLILLALIISMSVSVAHGNQLRVMTLGWGSPLRDHIEDLVLNRFASEYPDMEIEMMYGGVDAVVTSIVAGVGPDVAVSQISTRYLQPLNDYLETSPAVQQIRDEGGLGAFLFEQQLRMPFRSDDLMDGHIYHLPTFFTYPILGYGMNAAMFEEAGLVPFGPDASPHWEEVASAHRKLTEVDSDGDLEQVGVSLGRMVGRAGVIAAMFGVEFVDSETQTPALVNLENAMTFLYENFVLPYSWAEVNALGFFAGEAASWFPNANLAAETANHGIDGRSTWLPTTTGERLLKLNGWSWSMVAGANNPENARLFLDFTITEREWHENLFQDLAMAGAHALGAIAEEADRWTAGMPQAQSFWTTSLPQVDRVFTLRDHGERYGTWWDWSVVQSRWREIRSPWLQGEVAIRTLLEETDRLIAGDIEREERR